MFYLVRISCFFILIYVNYYLLRQIFQAHTLLDVLKVQLIGRGVDGIIGLQRKFVEIDNDESKSVDMKEFKTALKNAKLTFSDEQINILFIRIISMSIKPLMVCGYDTIQHFIIYFTTFLFGKFSFLQKIFSDDSFY